MQGVAYKIGKLVFFTINGLPKLSTTNEAFIRGLPYVPNTNYLGVYWSSGVQCSVCTITNESYVLFRKNDANTLRYSDIANRALFITGWYMTKK